jgi:NIMA-interacting peptidyl-prolyl cis-trans isomerase 1
MKPRSTPTIWLLTSASALALCGCGALATSPSWVGGGMAITGPLRMEQEETQISLERERLASQPDEIGARHVLVMHAESQHKPEGVQRTREQAFARAQECLKKLRAGGDFVKLVKEYSDEPGAVERGGDLGMFKRDVMVKDFADAAFALKVGEVSEVVETGFGYHIIKRTR